MADMAHEHGSHDRHHVHLDETAWAALAAHAELEGEVLLDFVTDAIDRVLELRGPAEVIRVLDVGSGPGVAACELARRFPAAEVVAIDASPAMLERAARRVVAHGLGDRVRTQVAELPDGLAGVGVGPADLVWASMSLHHVGDEVAALRAIAAVLADGGVVAINEHADDPVRFLPADLGVGRPGLVGRVDQAASTWFAAMRAGLAGAAPSADLTDMVESAGLEVLVNGVVTVHLPAPLAPDARRFAVDQITRMQAQLAHHLDDHDLATLEVLLDPGDPASIHHREDLEITATRRLVLARRPVRGVSGSGG